MKYLANSLLVANTLDQSVPLRTNWRCGGAYIHSGTNGEISPQSSAKEYHTRISQNCFVSRHNVQSVFLLLGLHGHRLNGVANPPE